MAKTFKIVAAVFVIVTALLLGGLLIDVNANNAATDSKQAAENNGRILEIIVAVTGCQPNRPPEECQAKIRAASTAEGARRIAEVDCVTRRAISGLPAPDPASSCIPQTPPEVYPG